MQPSEMGTGVCGSALVRAADAMLHSLGGEEISLLLPLQGMASDPAAQLGLVDPAVEELRISPVIARNLNTDNSGPRRRVEFLIPASGIGQALATHDFANADQLMNAAMGILHQGELFHIEGFVAEFFTGTAYLYRVVGVE